MRKAFSLIELMIVIVIIGVVYTLVISKLHSVAGEENKKLTLKNLKTYLYDQIGDGKKAKLLCLDDCVTCSVYIDGQKVASIEHFLDENVRVYSYSFLQGLQEKQMPSYFDADDVQQDVCFMFEVSKDKVASQDIVEYKEKVYDYTPYFKDVLVYDSLSECSQAKEALIQKVQ